MLIILLRHIESSLQISPKEQVEAEVPIYGKMGLGMAEGVVVDAWYTGFAEGGEGNLYFCVHLGRTDGMEASSSLAREIAIQIVSGDAL